MRILVVDDNASSWEALRCALESLSFRVTTLENGKAAIKELKEAQTTGAEPYRLMLVDWRMPEMDGYEATRRIRGCENLKTIPVIAMTAHVMAEHHAKAREAGMNDHISKPIDPERMARVISHWLKRERKTPERPPVPPGLSGRVGNTHPTGTSGLSSAPSIQPGRVGTAHPPKTSGLLPTVTIRGIDAPSALRLFGENEDALIRVLKSFRRDFWDIAGKIGAAFQSGQLDRVGELAHEIKGVSGNIAAKELHRFVCAFEDALKKGDAAAQKNFLEKMDAEVKNICRGIDDAFGKEGESVSTSAKSAGIDTAGLKPLLVQLGKLLAEKNLGATKLATAIDARLKGSALELEAKEMASRAQRLDSKGTGERLSKIAAALGD